VVYHARVEMRGDIESVKRARDYLAGTLKAWHLDGISEVALLLTSELVTNTVVHAHTPFELRVVFEEPRLTVEVRDDSPALPAAFQAQADDERGRGLALVDALSEHWGVRAEPHGKAVWFSLMSLQGLSCDGF
jgi:anti-sigma regulatory factor (Ser/Thr protein kinase)